MKTNLHVHLQALPRSGGAWPSTRRRPSALAGWLCGLALVAAPVLSHATPGAWTTLNRVLSEPKLLHNATLLNDGKVVINGGNGASNTDLYDPVANTITTNFYDHAGYQQSATLMNDGRVLVVGGLGYGGGSGSDIYSGGSWNSTGGTPPGYVNHTATLLPNGEVLFVGGGSPAAKKYNAGTDFYYTVSGITARESHTATLLPNGKVMITGGKDGSGTIIATTIEYNYSGGGVSTKGSLATARKWHTATLLANGKVLVAGGNDSSGSPLASCEIYDPSGGTWTSTGSLATARRVHTATLLPDGKVLVVGGSDGTNYLASCELFDPAGNSGVGSWSSTGSLNLGRINHTATLLTNGKVLVTGGYDGVSTTDSMETYDPSNGGEVSTTGSMTTARWYPSTSILPDGRVLVAGGSLTTTPTFTPTCRIYSAGSWTNTGNLNDERGYATATLLNNGKVLVAAGHNNGGYPKTCELFDPAGNSGVGSWSYTGSVTYGRHVHNCTLLADGRVLMVGGSTNLGWVLGCEIFDPAGNSGVGSWSTTDPLPAGGGEYFHTCTLLPSGKVLMTGGYNGSSYSSTCRLFDPAGNSGAGAWSTTDSLIAARAYHTATLLPNGKVLVAGGRNSSVYLSSCEIFDPAGNSGAGSWSSTGSMSATRSVHTATLLQDGRVLVAGGAHSAAQNTTEIYDWLAGTWASSDNLTTARYYHTATLLPSGEVLLSVGYSTAPLASAEVFNVGLGYAGSSKPVISTATSPITVGSGTLSLTGTVFTGVSEASGGGLQNSSSNYPVVQLRRVDNGQLKYLSLGSSGWSTTSTSSTTISSFPLGPVMATVFTNGIPGDSKVIVLQ